ncbi:MAG: M23 family metallopeptidase [Myxococcota bacterium]|nr:M23 family metallopeptidase [Myxococcota bacterium]
MKKAPPAPRGSLLDILLVVGVVLVVFARTPAGNLAKRAFGAATGMEVQAAPLTSTFSTQTAELNALVLRVSEQLPQQPGPLPTQWAAAEGAFPEPHRSAVQAALAEVDVPEHRLDLVDPSKPLAEQHLQALDALTQPGDSAEDVLVRYALGDQIAERSAERARRAGEQDPRSWQARRRYLGIGEQRQGDRLINTTLGTARLLTLQWPVPDDTRISSPFGFRDHPVLAKRKFHNGVDLSVPVGTPVLAAQEGTVSVAGSDAINGNYVVINHQGGIRTSYCHLDSLAVERKQQVQRGELIGNSGNTGRSTGPHLHFVVRVGGKAVDPEAFHAPVKPAETPTPKDKPTP